MLAKLLWEKQSHFCISCGPIGWYYVTILGGGGIFGKMSKDGRSNVGGKKHHSPTPPSGDFIPSLCNCLFIYHIIRLQYK